MSKYIIDLRPDCKVVQQICESDGKVYVGSTGVRYLEELTSDYINENFGELQDTAYKRGVNDGSLDVKERVDCAYQRGLEEGKKATFGLVADASNAEYQRGFEDGKAVHDKGCEGCEYAGKVVTGPPCITCCNSYRNQWTAKDDKIVVGDEVNWIGDCFIVTRIFQPHNMKEQCDGIDDDGCVYHDILMDDLEKTGRHFDIGKILEAMKHD